MGLKTVKLTDVATIKRASGEVYEKGTTLIQLSATKGDVLFLEEESPVSSKYAVVIPSEKIPAKYLYYSILHAAPRFFHKNQAGLNMQFDTLLEMTISIDDDKERQLEVVKKMEILDQKERKIENVISLYSDLKKTLTSELFP